MKNSLIALYQHIFFNHSKWVLLLAALLLGFLSQYAGNFRLDASSDSLVLENDQSLKYYREVVGSYNTADFLVLTYSPKKEVGNLFSKPVLDDLTLLRQRLLDLGEAKSILSILDVPLTQSPPLTLAELNGKLQTLRDEKTDLELAKIELKDSQLYRDLLVSPDYSTTAVIISLNGDPELSNLTDQRNSLRELRSSQGLTDQQNQDLKRITQQHQTRATAFQAQQNKLISDVREIVVAHQDKAVIFLGGLPMIVTDSIQFIQDDVVVFGGAALLIIILILAVAFRQVGWVLMPLTVCFASGYIMVCLLGLLNWPISVVSSNFLSLLLIITLSLNIHLIVRYRELSKLHPEHDQLSLVRDTISSKFIACVYTSLTTVVAFASLIVSGIRPVIDFGYIMCLGIAVSLVTTFILFPALALMMKPRKVSHNRDTLSKAILSSAEKLYQQKTIALTSIAVAFAFAIYGLANLTVENRFIDYFKPDTEIYQGMHQIDEKLGGTTPLDIILDAPVSFFSDQEDLATQQMQVDSSSESADDDFDDFDDFDDDFGEPDTDAQGNLAVSSYWFNDQGISQIKSIHDALEALPETGKVLSLATSMSIFETLKDAKPMDNIDLGFMYNVLSDELKDTLFVPYMSADGNQVHISIRVFETHKGLDRNKLVSDIHQMLVDDHGLDSEQINITGMLVLYNNMLNSLFNSQILTLGTVFLVIMLMFVVLFRNFKLALITIIPNVFSAGIVLGIMGIFSIPLDLMTITIAAITVGIAVDNSIHFVARFREESTLRDNYPDAIQQATNNVGQAMFYTTLVITAGFLIMVFSNFVPTMYFGILTAIAMGTALLANLIMLPMLLSRFKPV